MRSETPHGWTDTTIGEVLTLQRGFDITKAEQRPGSIPVVSSGGISSYHDTATVAGPGVVIGRKGALGTVFYLKGHYWPHDTTLWVKDFHGNDPRYAYYFFKSLDLLRLDVGSANPTLNRNHVHPLRVRWPPKTEQRRIVAILGVLDDKIDSNRRAAGLGAETAATFFRARLVDFIGVEELEKSEIGMIPRGWRAGTLIDLARFVNGKAFTKDASGRGRPIIRIREMNSGIDKNTLRSDVPADDRFVARESDILFAWSGSLGVLRWSGAESLINQHIFKVIPNDDYPPWFVYEWICRHLPEFRAIASEKATTMGHIKREHLDAALVAIPDRVAIAAAAAVLDPIEAKLTALNSEASTLTALRDALLPKLISGQIRVPDTGDAEYVAESLAERLGTAGS